MSILPDPPTGRSHAHRGLADQALASSLRAGVSDFESALINSINFDRHVFDFGEVLMPDHQVGATGFFVYEESNAANTAFVKATVTPTRQSHIFADITVDDSQISLVTVAQFLSGQNPWLEVAFALESITELDITIGFSDPAAIDAGEMVSGIDVPAVASITDCAFLALDTDETADTVHMVTRDNSTTRAVIGSPLAAPFGIPTVITQVVYRVELRGTTAYGFINGVLVAQSAAGAGPRPAVLLEAVIMFGNNHTTDKEVHIDYIDVGQERLSQPF